MPLLHGRRRPYFAIATLELPLIFGTRWQYTLVRPDSSREVVLDVPHYDFNWQTYYMFATPLEMPPGARLA